jgi:hypothetical protein
MKEQEQGEAHNGSEQVRQNLLDHLKDVEFGSIKHWAAIDYFNLGYQESLLSTQRKNLLSVRRNQEKKMYWESEVRIREVHIALLERDIDRNKSRVPGYSKAYMYLVSSFDQLGDLSNKEALSKYPTDKEMRDQYGQSVFESIHDEISHLVYARQDQS